MPPKGKKGGNAKDNKSNEERREQPHQAVVFADSFETRFNPFTLERPRCLLPLANTPLLEYTLDFLAGAGAEEVYLYCGNHTEAVEEHLEGSKWTDGTCPFTLEIIRSTSRSVGDCMRDLDQKQLIVGDFICVYGDVVTNISIDSALAAHRERRVKDKKAIMTMVLREAGERHRTKPHHITPTFVIDSETGRCVHYEQVRPGQNAALDIPGEVLTDHVELEVREDLIDCGVDICTPEVLAQYTDNFDWQLPRAGFLRGVLKDFETFQLTIHTHIATQGYAARVKNLQAYAAISKDVLSRWTYPLTPDNNLLSHQSFEHQKGNVYRENAVVLARTCVINKRVVLGKATSIGDHSTITNSVIGRRCVIGNRVKLDGAYIWDDARIGDDTVIETAIIGNDAIIGKRCKIEEGALISFGVKIADGTTVAGDRRVTTLKRKRDNEGRGGICAQVDPDVVGKEGFGYHFELDDDEEELENTLLVSLQTMDLAVDKTSVLGSDDEEDEDYFAHHHAHSDSIRSASFASVDSQESGDTRRQAQDFHKEAVGSLFDDLQKGGDPDTMQLEFKSLIFSHNAQDNQIRRALAVGINRRIASLVESGTSPKDAVGSVIPRYNQLIGAYLKEQAWQAEYLVFTQIDLVHRPKGSKILLFLSNALATNDLVEAEGFEMWWNDPKGSATGELEAVRKETKPLVDVLCADDDEDSEEDEDSDEE